MPSTSDFPSDRLSEAEIRAMNALAAEREAKASLFTGIGHFLTVIAKPLVWSLQHYKQDPE